jgi:DNA sulfur modification protein DndD
VQLLNLTVDNLGVFRSHHTLDLRPVREPEDSDARGLTIVRGENGAGKSTLFKALGLALHGSLSLGSRVSRQAYNEFLLSRLHRRSVAGDTTVSDEGGVALSFRYVSSGRPTVIDIERRWLRSGKNVSESLTVRRDGEPPEVERSDYQTYLNDLVPPGVASLSFFDAELLDSLTVPEERGGALLGETLRRLLGLDLVERLQTDLAQYTRRHGGGKARRLGKEVLEHQKAVDEIDSQLTHLKANTETLEEERAKLETELERQEHRLAAEGGTYAERRPMLQERQLVIGGEIESVSEQLRELSSGLLPFALVPGLCRTLADKLTREAKLHRIEVAGELLQEQVSGVESALHGDELWQDLDLSPGVRDAIARRVAQMMREVCFTAESNGQAPVHRLAEPEHDRLQRWIAQALHSVPQQTRALGERLRNLKQERRRIEEDLRRAPDDETLAPIHSEIERLQTGLAEVQRRQKELDEKLGALRFQREERARQRKRADDELREALSGERRMDLAERSKVVLRSYQDALIRRRLAALEEAVVESFNAICHKEHLLGAATLDPDTFEVRLESLNGRMLRLDDFSAGERQLFALALLRALRQVSKRQLPLAIDTPVARLDGVHRERFVHNYVPEVSDQVLLFVTDAEMDAEMLEQTQPYLARLYHLYHDEGRGETWISRSDGGNHGSSEPISLGRRAAKGQSDADS